MLDGRTGARHLSVALAEADVAATGLESSAYDLVTVCLVDEHLPDLRPSTARRFDWLGRAHSWC